MLTNHRFIRALYRQPVDRTPAWIMRQAGRYLPEYRALRQKTKDFLTLCKTPELACTVTLQPLERFPLDAAIIFSDILTIPDAYQMGLQFLEGEGPRFKHPICTIKDIQQLPTIDPEVELKYVMDAIRMVKANLHDRVPLIGFAGSPWTISTYMVEGGTSKNFSKIKKLLYAEPDGLHQLLAHLTKSITDYLQAQINAGVDVIMLFDTWGGLLTYPDYLQFSLQYMEQIIKNLQALPHTQKIPTILFTKNSASYLKAMADTGCTAIGLDWTIPLDWARQLIGEQVALQGNLDPAVLYGSTDCIQDQVQKILAQFGKGSGHIFNLGHGIHADVEPHQVATLIEAVQKFSIPYHL